MIYTDTLTVILHTMSEREVTSNTGLLLSLL